MELILNRGLAFTSILANRSNVLKIHRPLLACYTCCIDRENKRSKSPGKHFFHRNSSSNYHLLSNFLSVNQKMCVYNVTPIQYNYCTSKTPQDDKAPTPEKKVSIFQKMKQMGKDYWHILIPVHIVTSIGWTAIFYTAATNGVDIAGIMEYFNFSEKYLEMVRNSSAGYWALTYALYKIFTPLRYAVTVGGTTLAIRHLNKFGYLKSSEVFNKTRFTQAMQPKRSTTENKERSDGAKQ